VCAARTDGGDCETLELRQYLRRSIRPIVLSVRIRGNRVEYLSGKKVLPTPGLGRLIGTFYLIAQKLIFHNSDLNTLDTTSSILMHH
jgi:hypothetical protein